MAALHRTKPLPAAQGVGCLIVSASVVRRTNELLREAGDRQPPHEGLVWWIGRTVEPDSLVVSCCSPQVDSGPQHVLADEASVRSASRASRRLRLGVIAQVHSHPGDDTRHSDGDDDLVLMPFERMYSLVVARYGRRSVLPADGASLHQYRDGRWARICNPEAVFIVAPDEVCA